MCAKVYNERTDVVRPTQGWFMDFMADELFNGRRIRLLTIVDNFIRISFFVGVGFGYRGSDVTVALDTAVKRYGVPERIQSNNCPERVFRRKPSLDSDPFRHLPGEPIRRWII